jgi:Capsule assembly protein Wzi
MTLFTYFNKTAIIVFLLLPFFSWGQAKKEIEIGSYFSSGQNPFWLRTNQYGIVPLESQFATLRGQVSKDYDSTVTKKKINYGYGIIGVVNVGKINQFLLPSAYAKVKWKAFEIYAGRRKEIIGLVDTTLTSGSYIWSGNALPLPKLQISIPEYTSILGKGLVSIKGNYSHGWFDKGYATNFFLHQKSLYGRIGKPSWKLKFYGGFNHQVQWGGKPVVPFKETKTGNLIEKYPSGLKTYLQVVTGIALNKDGTGLEEGIPLNEAWNRVGNHLGSIDIGFDISTSNATLLFYRQSIYEDGSLFHLNNIIDGLTGFSIQKKGKKNGIQGFVFEYLNTSNQGGSPGGTVTIPELRGYDNYFNNSLYRNGWTYQGSTIGTPFIVPLNALDATLFSKKISPTLPTSYIVNNRTQILHTSLAMRIGSTSLLSKFTYSKNYGTYSNYLRSEDYLVLQQVTFRVRKHSTVTINASADLGKLYGATNLGGSILLKRSW